MTATMLLPLKVSTSSAVAAGGSDVQVQPRTRALHAASDFDELVDDAKRACVGNRVAIERRRSCSKAEIRLMRTL